MAQNLALESAGDFGEDQSAKIDLPRFAGYADPPLSAGFAILGSGCRGLAQMELYAPDCAHMASLPDYFSPINPTGRNACTKAQ
ncbi:MAG: hypothetical protein ACJ8AW_14915 [Rhodopila sp.]